MGTINACQIIVTYPIVVGIMQLHVWMVRDYGRVLAKVFRSAFELLAWFALICAIVLFRHFFQEPKR